MLNRLGPPLLVLAVAIVVVGLSYSGALGGERAPERPSIVPEPTVVIDLSEQADELPIDSPSTSSSDAVPANGLKESGDVEQQPATGEMVPDGRGEEAPGAAGGSVPHVVGEGETLWSIARGHGVSVDELMEANGIQDPTALQVGEELDIP